MHLSLTISAHPALLQDNHESALFYFQQLLDRKPSHYTALVQLLGLLRRAGKLDEAVKFIAAAEQAAAGGAPGHVSGSSSAPRSEPQTPKAPGALAPAPVVSGVGGVGDAGLQYCKGLLEW